MSSRISRISRSAEKPPSRPPTIADAFARSAPSAVADCPWAPAEARGDRRDHVGEAGVKDLRLGFGEA